MARHGRWLTDAQWEKIRPLLPGTPKRPRGGRPRANDRKVLEGILWLLRSGARGQDMPEEFPSPATCWRRLRDWEEQEVWLRIGRAFWAEFNERQQLKWSEAFRDGSFAPAKKGALRSGKAGGARGRRGGWGSRARVFLGESDFTLLPHRKSGWRKKRWLRSESDGGTAADAHGKNPSG
jgi:transposase